MLLRVRNGRSLLWKPTEQTKENTMKRLLLVGAAAMLSLALTVPAFAHEAGEWIVRGGIGTVMPKDDNLTLPELTLTIPEVSPDPVTINSTVQVDDGTSLTLSFTYMFTDNWALDVLAAWPFKHDVDLDASILVGGDTISGPVPFGEVEHLPPTFSVQYHFLPEAQFQPFVGLGVNYTTFLSEDLADVLVGSDITDYSLDDSFGVAVQLGADWMISDRSLINFDLRWINIEADLDVTLTGGSTASLGAVEIDPWVFAINYGYKF